MARSLSRRSFLLGVTATGGLIAGGWAGQPYAKRLYSRAYRLYRRTFPVQAPIAPAAFLSVDPDGTVTAASDCRVIFDPQFLGANAPDRCGHTRDVCCRCRREMGCLRRGHYG